MCITLAIPGDERGAAMLRLTTFLRPEDLSRISSQARSGRAFREARFWTRIETSSGCSVPMSPARVKPFSWAPLKIGYETGAIPSIWDPLRQPRRLFLPLSWVNQTSESPRIMQCIRGLKMSRILVNLWLASKDSISIGSEERLTKRVGACAGSPTTVTRTAGPTMCATPQVIRSSAFP